MGTNRTSDYSTEQVSLACYAEALAHPARVAIIALLLERKNCICGNIVDDLPLSQSTVSQHLKVLKKVGIIKGTIEGASVCYCIDEGTWNKIQDSFQSFFGVPKPQIEHCYP